MALTGRWRIVEMDLFDASDLDLLGPAFIELRRIAPADSSSSPWQDRSTAAPRSETGASASSSAGMGPTSVIRCADAGGHF